MSDTGGLERASIERQTLEAAAKKLEEQAGNTVYQLAWKKAAKIIRSLKPD